MPANGRIAKCTASLHTCIVQVKLSLGNGLSVCRYYTAAPPTRLQWGTLAQHTPPWENVMQTKDVIVSSIGIYWQLPKTRGLLQVDVPAITYRKRSTKRWDRDTFTRSGGWNTRYWMILPTILLSRCSYSLP